MDAQILKMRQAMSLEDKIRFTERRITEWVEYWGIEHVYISFSGGKDSTVLLDIARRMYTAIPAMYVDTGLEYPEIKEFVKSKENIDIVRPAKMFNRVVEEHGFPIISKEVSEAVENARKHLQDGTKYRAHYEKLMGIRKNKDGTLSTWNCKKWKFLLEAPFKVSNKCCNIMKKAPAHKYSKETKRYPIIATMASESIQRKAQYIRQGCNAFKNKIPTSTPMAFWTEQDVLQYLHDKHIPYATVYGNIVQADGKFSTTGCERTGCMFCGFGCQLDKTPNRFQRLKQTHPKQYDYIINKLGMRQVLDYIGVAYE